MNNKSLPDTYLEEVRANEEKIKIGWALLGFAVLCFITSLVFNSNVGEPITKILSPADNIVGPIEVRENNEVYQIKISQPIRAYGTWSVVEGSVLDNDKNYLFGFSDELGSYAGRDSEGRWTEVKNDYEMKLTMPQTGTYYLSFSFDTNNPGAVDPVRVTVARKKGSSLVLFWAGILAFVFGAGYIWINMEAEKEIRKKAGRMKFKSRMKR
ncbi:MAG: hypothetical protein V3S46_06540 [Nitrospinota bacterium]